MTDLRGEKVDEGKVWAACPRCAALRGEVERLRDAVEWVLSLPYVFGDAGENDQGFRNELRRRAGRDG